MNTSAMRRSLLVLLLVAAVILSGCGKPKQEEAKTEPSEEIVATAVDSEAPSLQDEYELPGEYAIDLSKLGMALTFYLRIDEENNFLLSANRSFSDDRGSGVIGELEGTYMMIYSDSTPDRTKTATFERVGHNLLFQSSLPYGSTNILFELQDEDDPEIVHRLMANKFVYEEYYNTYLGFSEDDGIEYAYTLQTGPGARYSFNSVYEGEDGPLSFSEHGLFTVRGETMTLVPQEGVELAGFITAEGGLLLPVKSTETGARMEQLLRVATTAKDAGAWYGLALVDGEEVAGELVLDYFGGYIFTARNPEGDYIQQGIFEPAQDSITFIAAGEGVTPVVAAKENYTLKASFNLADGGPQAEWLFYDEAVQGRFSGSTMAAEAYVAVLELTPDGRYGLTVIDEQNDGAILLEQAGDFAVSVSPMAYLITLTSDDSEVSVGQIWPTGLNMTIEVTGDNFSFLLTK